LDHHVDLYQEEKPFVPSAGLFFREDRREALVVFPEARPVASKSTDERYLLLLLVLSK